MSSKFKAHSQKKQRNAEYAEKHRKPTGPAKRHRRFNKMSQPAINLPVIVSASHRSQ